MTEDYPDLTDKTVFVTGASRGIGAAVAKASATAGAHVILLARTIGALESVDDEIRKSGGKATLMPFDLRKLEELDNLGPLLADKFGGLDILIANAGALGVLGPLPHALTKDWQPVIDVNFQANFRLIRTLDPLLRAAGDGRAVFTTSGLGERPKAYWGAYAVSKAALNMMVRIYAAETEKTDLRVNLLDPGVVDTALLSKAFPGGYQGETKETEDVVPAFMHLISPDCTTHGEIVKASDFTPDAAHGGVKPSKKKA